MTLLDIATLKEKCDAVMQSKSKGIPFGNTIKLRGSPKCIVVPSNDGNIIMTQSVTALVW